MFNQELTSDDLQQANLFGRSVKKIVTPQIRDLILDHLLQTYNIRMNCTNKYFRSFDSQLDTPTLLKFPHVVYVNTNQPINLVALVSFKGKPHCLYIDKLKSEIYDIKCHFSASLYEGTIFEGEVVETPQGHIFLISDFLVYMQTDLAMVKLNPRLDLLKSIIRGGHYQSDPVLEPFKMVMKDFVELSETECFIRKYINRFTYKSCISGLVFRPAGTNNKNLIANFPREMMLQLFQSDAINVHTKKHLPTTNRNQAPRDQSATHRDQSATHRDQSATHRDQSVATHSNLSSLIQKNDTKSVKVAVEAPKSVPIISASMERKEINHQKHKEVKFQLFDTGNPDDYVLKLLNPDGQLVQYGYALCNDMKTSLYLQKYLDETSMNEKKNGLCVTCQYYPAFKKWKPVKFVPDQKPNTVAEVTSM